VTRVGGTLGQNWGMTPNIFFAYNVFNFTTMIMHILTTIPSQVMAYVSRDSRGLFFMGISNYAFYSTPPLDNENIFS
jgi:hypothetical protein